MNRPTRPEALVVLIAAVGAFERVVHLHLSVGVPDEKLGEVTAD